MIHFWPCFLPLYAYLGGLTYACVHRRDHDRDNCFQQSPLCVLCGIFWPVVVVVMSLTLCVRMGVRTEVWFRKYGWDSEEAIKNAQEAQEQAISKAEEELKQVNDKLNQIGSYDFLWSRSPRS